MPGNPKYTTSYGEYDIHHNTISLEDPRTPFKLTPMSGSRSAGIFKGSDYGFTTPATVNTLIQMPWMQLLQSNVSVKTVMAGGYGVSQTLSSPVQYERTIVYPDTDYFVVVDRFEGTQPWVYRNIFRPTSLMVTPTVDTNKDGSYTGEIGHVNGNLVIGSTSYNWLPLSPKTETPTGITSNSLTWTTKNPYGKDVRLNMFSAPSSEILIEKNTGRIGGYSAQSEVYSPVVYFRTPAATSEYRVTALLSSYATEVPKSATEIPVTGTGHAVKVSSASSDDYIYTGKGTSSFAGFSTDADTAYIRNVGSNNEFTLINGASLKKNTSTIVSISKKLDYFTLKQEGKEIKFRIKGDSSGYITLNNIVATSVLRDGVVYNDWDLDQNSKTLTISTTLTEHEFEISSEDYLIIDPISRQTVNINENLIFPLSVTYTGTGVLRASASNLPQYSTFNTTSRTFSWTPNKNQVGKYSVTFIVTDGRMSDSSTMLITVKEENQAPVFEDIENKTVIVHSTLQFAINATDADGDPLTYSASGLPRNATFDSAHRIFSWNPDTNQTGEFIVLFDVTDGRQSDSSSVLITVKELNRDPLLNRAPVFEDIENKTVIVHSTLQFAINATDADGDLLTYSASGLPRNATFHPANHTFIWTPADGQVGSFNVTFMVSDRLLTDNQSVQIRVRESTNNAPVFGAIADVSVNQKETLTVNVTASDPDGDTLTYSASNLPSGSKFYPETRKFTWSPAYNQTGNYTVTFRVTDGKVSSSRNVTFTAVKVNYAPYFPWVTLPQKQSTREPRYG